MTNDIQSGDKTPVSPRRNLGGIILLIAGLAVIFLLSILFLIFGWREGSAANVPVSGYIAMGIGVVVSLACGFGLMMLLFFSSRKGYDDPPTYILPPSDPDAER
ncbi:hypothetical protein G3545_26220 [Starkeya sp. ORNL1]|uniref:hypothetical protein n=1 Tax=Starkeya sp. ORNL1 TaxID=2709380 RepID=UPI001463F4F1|nr:hypothetical protein [Starkeya sp. ORNL1]QJP16826.1 hypothetical protein G3545_26220 [Starkeya sp. ORNL1]